ncbi:hypothetical protein RvY_12746 [Ramazzottius varieornatus]|uniref:Uncharacterized protein n=1 Tax=Ramazzottius varieornatus TaxID=947166 RepID=A0A1D1VKJ3_RAMVA|nr:hypothetical protein RvY_12746 [Ramazzottius varieornatus]
MARSSAVSAENVGTLRALSYLVVTYTLVSAVLLVFPDFLNAALPFSVFSHWKQVIRYILTGVLTASGLALWRGIASNRRELLLIWLILYGITTIFIALVITIGLFSGQFNLYLPNWKWGFWNHKSWLEDGVIFLLMGAVGLDIASLKVVYDLYTQLGGSRKLKV